MADQTPPNNRAQHRSITTPPPPPYSPVTPVMSHSTLLPSPAPEPLPFSSFAIPQLPASSLQQQHPIQQPPQPVVAPEPAPMPISESDNPDAIALRSTLSILQIQRQRALHDIRSLDSLKGVATQDPEGFARELKEGRLKVEKGDILRPRPIDDDNEEKSAMDLDDGAASKTKFETLPSPQNIVRMPPVNWAKYHIVGEALDSLHEEQRRRPTPGEPRRDAPASSPPGRNPEHYIAAPYRPFVDQVEPHTRPLTRGANKRKREQT